MKIGFDARMSSPLKSGGGIGRYVEGFQRAALSRTDVDWTWYEHSHVPHNTTPHHQYVTAPIDWYGFSEQYRMGPLMDRDHLDLVHIPHWNVSQRLKTPFVCTVHDLIPLEEGFHPPSSTRSALIYRLKWAGFQFVLKHAVFVSQRIITVSHTSKRRLMHFFPSLSEEKIVVIEPGILAPVPHLVGTPLFEEPYLLYVGNCYPHKQVDLLLNAWKTTRTRATHLLVIAGRGDAFFEELRKKNSDVRVRYVANPDDHTLEQLYQHAQGVACPSRLEGFGLPALEAIARTIPVIASDIPIYHETLKTSAAFFDPTDTPTCSEQIDYFLDEQKHFQALATAYKNEVRYLTWERAVDKTVALYRSVIDT